MARFFFGRKSYDCFSLSIMSPLGKFSYPHVLLRKFQQSSSSVAVRRNLDSMAAHTRVFICIFFFKNIINIIST